MIAYPNALLGTGTTMVLSPDSEFFRYFRSPSGVPSPAPPADAGALPPATEPGHQRPAPSSRGPACPISWPPWAWSSSSRAWSMAAFPALRSALRPKFSATPENVLRMLGLAAIAAGVGIVWLVRG